MLKLIVNGEDAFVSSSTEVSQYLEYVLKSEWFLDIRNEALPYTKEDIQQLRLEKQDELIKLAFDDGTCFKFTPNRLRNKTWKDTKSLVPKSGSLHPISEDRQLQLWLEKCKGLPGDDKLPLFLEKLETVRNSGRDVYLPVLTCVLLADPLVFLNSLFMENYIKEASELECILVPEVLIPILDVKDSVNGRGEILSTFLFSDVVWKRGTGTHDIQGIDGGWHCKELTTGYDVRLGRSSYTCSRLCEQLTELSKLGSWTPVGKCDVRSGLTKGIIETNRELIELNIWDNVEDVMQREMLLSEQDTQGVVFFKGDKCYVRKMCDCVCRSATKADWRVSPRRTSK